MNKIDLLISELTNFYRDENNCKKFYDRIECRNKASLRNIDWFVYYYAKKYNTNYLVDNKIFYVHREHKNQLLFWGKRYFDCFGHRRDDRISIPNRNQTDTRHIAIGMLNFFRWAIENQIIDYVENNLYQIENDMNSSIRKL